MDSILIEGGRRLSGEVEASGAKNASLPLMAAALLAESPSRLQGIPRLQDIVTMSAMLERLGARVARAERRGDPHGDLAIDPTDFADLEAPYDLVRKMRASIYVLGPLLGRFGHARVSLPGGCAIGTRPIDLHLRGMEALGATVAIDHGYVDARAPQGRLRGADCIIEGPNGSSVGATCNVLMAAVLAKGRSVLRGAAREPEVGDLIGFLNAMGARIKGAGTSVLEVDGVEGLRGAERRVIPDRIEAGTLLVAAAITGGDVAVRGCIPEHLAEVLVKLEEMGVEIERGEDRVRARYVGRLRPLAVRTMPYPGFPTDMQAQLMAALCLTPGESTITETIYPDRFIHVAELHRMGADITLAHATAVVRGVEKLSGASVMASDLRASAALVLAGLAAEGETECLRVYHLDRGYEQLERKLSQLGAVIERVRYRRTR